MKILIVDDSKAMRTLLKRSLRMAGFSHHDTAEAENGADAVQAVAKELPDLVISDWNMPKMSGLELLQTLRANGSTVTFGFVTTEASDEMRAAAKQAGAHFLITKPFTPETIESTLTPVLGD
ncbi:MAG: response regulator [Gammaproteobacteria bacterium]|nr:response regulator [Gammaproteobacteria bacterium]